MDAGTLNNIGITVAGALAVMLFYRIGKKADDDRNDARSRNAQETQEKDAREEKRDA